MVAKRSTKMGKVKPYVDVRSEKDVPAFESMLQVGPVYVLVYADWCGHCQRFKQNMWDEVAQSNNKSVNAAAVHYDMMNKTSMKNTSIEGYPTLFEVKKSTMKNVSTPVPTPQTKEELESLLNTTATTNSNSMKSAQLMMNSSRATADTFEPQSLETLPPNVESDTLVEEVKINKPTSVQGGGHRGGSLMESLIKLTADSAHVALLASSAIELHRRLKKQKKSRKRHSGRKSQTRRR